MEDTTPKRRSRLCLRVMGVGVGLVGAALVGLQTPPACDWLAGQVQQLAQGFLAEGWTVDKPGLMWRLDGRLALTDVVLRDPAGEVAIGVRRLDAQLDPSWLVWRTVRITSLRGDGVHVAMDQDADAVLNLVRAFGGPSKEPVDPDAPPWGGLPVEIRVEDVDLRDGLVSLWGPPPEVGPPGGFKAKIIGLKGSVRMPRNTPEVRLGGLDLDGVLLHPGPTSVQLDGASVVWTGEGVLLDHATLLADGSRLAIHGYARDLWGEGRVDATIEATSLDLGLVDRLVGTGTAGVYSGAFEASGTLSGLSLSGSLTGEQGARGTLQVEPGTVVCLPTGVAGPDRCGVDGATITKDAPLRWKAGVRAEGFHLEDVMPSLGGPLRLEGALSARGGGTAWPDGVFVDEGRYTANDLDIYGIPVRYADAGLSLHEGTLSFTDLDVIGVVGSAAGRGSIDLVSGALNLGLTGTIQGEMLSDMGVDDLGGRGTYRARVTGRVFDDGAPIHFDGDLKVAPIRWANDVHVASASGTLQGDVVHGVVDVRAALQADGIEAYGVSTDHVDAANVRLRVKDGGIDLSGDVASELVRYGDVVRIEDVTARVDLKVTGEGSMSLDAHADVGNQDLAGLLGNNGTVDVKLRDSDLFVDANLRWDDTPFIVSPDVELNLDTMTVDVGSLIFQPTMRQRWTLSRPMHARLVDGGVADADLAVSSDLGAIEVKGNLATVGQLGGSVVTKGFQLDALAEMFPEMFGGLAGKVDAKVTAVGSARQPNLVLNIDAEDLFWEDRFRYLGLSGQVNVVQDVATVRVLTTVVDAPFVRLDGFLPIESNLSKPGLSSSGDTNLHVVVEPGSFERAAHLVPDLEVPEGILSGVLRISGDLHDPDLELQAVTEVRVPGLRDRLRGEVDLVRDSGELIVSLDAYEGYEPVLLAEGLAQTRLSEVMDWLLAGADQPDFTDASLFADDLDVHARLWDLPLVSLVELSGQDLDVQGAMTGDIRVRGRPKAPELDIDLRADALIAGEPALLGLTLHPEDPGYHLDLHVGDASSKWLTVAGRVPIRIDLSKDLRDWGTSTFDLTIAGRGLPLGLARVADRGVRKAEGTVRLEGSLTGTWVDPVPDVAMFVENGQLQYQPLGIAVRDLEAVLHARPLREGLTGGQMAIVLDSLSATPRPLSGSLDRLTALGESRITAEATVDLDGWFPSDVRGQVKLTDAWLVALDDFIARISGSLRVGGTWPALTLRGDASVNQGHVELNTDDLLASRTMQVDPIIRIHRGETFTQRVVDDAPSWLDEVTASLQVDLGRNMNMKLRAPLFDDLGAFAASLTRADIEARLGGQLRVGMRGGTVSVVGDVETLSGRVDVLRGKFDLLDGSRVTFLGEDYANPQLDISGAMNVAGGQIGLRLRGPASEPSFQFTSDDFGSDAALFTILLTGRAPDDLSADQGRSAVEAVSDLLLNSVLGGVSLGSVSVEADGTVSVGLPVYRTVFLETAYTPAPRLNENNIKVEAEWSIMPRLLLNAYYGDRLAAGNLFYELRLTTVCDNLRRAYREFGGDDVAISARCSQVRAAVKEHRARGDESPRRRSPKAPLSAPVPEPALEPDEAVVPETPPSSDPNLVP